MLSSDACSQLISLVSEEIGACAVMRECVDHQRRAIIERDLDAIEQTTCALRAAALGVQEAAASRTRMLQDIARQHGLAMDEVWREDGTVFGATGAQQWQRAWRTLSDMCSDLRRDAQLNGDILSDALSYTRLLLKAIMPEEPGYGRPTYRPGTPASA